MYPPWQKRTNRIRVTEFGRPDNQVQEDVRLAESDFDKVWGGRSMVGRIPETFFHLRKRVPRVFCSRDKTKRSPSVVHQRLFFFGEKMIPAPG
jgi:hypothetical protein